jgi:molybdopterin-guanine dinucleotide biosynthesis protein A
MGRDKALIELGGVALVGRVAATLRAAGADPIVIGRRSVPGELTAFPDDLPDRSGPAAGLATALRLAGRRPVVLVATDQPFLRIETVRSLLAIDGDAVVPIDDGVRQTTCAVYRQGCAGPLGDLLRRGTGVSIQTLLDIVETRDVTERDWSAWGEDGRSWWSLDTPQDVEQAEEWLAGNREPGAGSLEP